jgi:glycosyltransferase involved in cell wall biosynthesis
VRILLANKFFFRNGGSEVVMFQERDFLLRHRHEVIDFSMKDGRNLESAHSGWFVEQQGYRRGGKLAKVRSALTLVHSPEATRKLGALIDATRPDLVHCHNIYHQLTPSIIGIAEARGIPVVLTLHDYKLVCPVYNRLRQGQPCSACIDGDFTNVLRNSCADDSLGKSALLYAEAMLQRRMRNYEKVHTYIAPSQFMKDSVSHRIPSERIRLLYNGIDPETDGTTGSHDESYVLYLGRLSAEKGIATLLAAHANSGNRWRLVVAGTGPLETQLRQQYSSPTYTGHLAMDEVKVALERASLIVVPSEGYENCPMSVLEAMAYGKPVIGSRIGGIPELVVDGETGLLFDAGNADELASAITRLMDAPDLRRDMGRKARARVESHYSLEAHNRGLLGIYESVLRNQHKA